MMMLLMMATMMMMMMAVLRDETRGPCLSGVTRSIRRGRGRSPITIYILAPLYNFYKPALQFLHIGPTLLFIHIGPTLQFLKAHSIEIYKSVSTYWSAIKIYPLTPQSTFLHACRSFITIYELTALYNFYMAYHFYRLPITIYIVDPHYKTHFT